MVEHNPGDFQQAKQLFLAHVIRFTELVPYVIDDSVGQIQITLAAGKLRHFIEIIWRRISTPPENWSEIAEQFNAHLLRLEQLIGQIETRFITVQIGSLLSSKTALGDRLLSMPRADLDTLLGKLRTLDRSYTSADLSALLAKWEGDNSEPGAGFEVIEEIKLLLYVMNELIWRSPPPPQLVGDPERLVPLLILLLKALDQRLEGAASRKASHLDACRIDFLLADGYADNNDITNEWTLEYRVNGNVFTRAEFPDPKAIGPDKKLHFFAVVRGFKYRPQIGSFIEGRCSEEIEITVETNVKATLSTIQVAGKANTLKYKVFCPGVASGQTASVKLVDIRHYSG